MKEAGKEGEKELGGGKEKRVSATTWLNALGGEKKREKQSKCLKTIDVPLGDIDENQVEVQKIASSSKYLV